MRALVVGASGFVASALARSLLEHGHTVVGLSRYPARARARVGERIEVAQGSIASPAEMARAARGCDVVFHAAGVAALDAPPRVLRWVHVAGTENVLKAARHAGVRRVVYGSCADVSLVDEDRMHWDEQRSLPEPPVGPHARTQLMAEELALAASDDTLEVTALRPARLWGPDDVDGIVAFARAVRRGAPTLFSGGRNLIATTHIDNLTRAALSAATASSAPGRAYYVTDGEFMEAHEFHARLTSALLLSAPARNLPLPIALVLARAKDVLAGGRGAARAALLRAGRSALFDVSRAVRDLDYQATVDLDARFAELDEWVAAEGGIEGLEARARPRPGDADVDAQVAAAGGD
ncbi:MAG: NAD-dependent epimerase/dehydratase family protein [Polyangiales bacterium]